MPYRTTFRRTAGIVVLFVFVVSFLTVGTFLTEAAVDWFIPPKG